MESHDENLFKSLDLCITFMIFFSRKPNYVEKGFGISSSYECRVCVSAPR